MSFDSGGRSAQSSYDKKSSIVSDKLSLICEGRSSRSATFGLSHVEFQKLRLEEGPMNQEIGSRKVSWTERIKFHTVEFVI